MVDLNSVFLLGISFSLGAVLGSFLNVLIDRLSTGRNFIKGRSYCEHCKKTLKTGDLLPIVSYLILRGKCRYCKKPIPSRLFLVEVLSGVLFTGLLYYSYAIHLPYIAVPFLILTLWAYLGIFFADLQYGIIPDLLVGISLVVSAFFVIFSGQPFTTHVLSALGAFLFFMFLFVLTRGKGMGFGDVKLSFSMGLFLGFPLIVVALYSAFLTGAAVSIILVIWRRIRFFGGTIPFGPFLIGGIFFTYFFGNFLVQTFFLRFFSF